MTQVPPILQPPSPLTPEAQDQVRRAAALRRPVSSATRVALGSAVTMLLVAALSVPVLMLSFSATNLLVVLALIGLGIQEYRGYRSLKRLAPAAPRQLGINQVCLLGLIVFYCAMQMATASSGDIKAMVVSPEFRSALQQMPSGGGLNDLVAQADRWAPLAIYGFYSLVLLLGVLFQGGLAWYYFSRRKHLDRYLHAAPPPIRQLFTELEG